MNLLVVEDLTTSRTLLRTQLEAEGHAVTEAVNGEDALGVLERQSVDGIIFRTPAAAAVVLAALHPPARADEAYLLERFDGALVHKLETRNKELQESLAQIHRAHEEILELNRTLETRISQHTTALEAANAELEAISRTVAAARRTDELAETLAEFLRLRHAPLNRVMLDLDALVKEVIATLHAELAELGIEWERRDLTYAYGDPILLRQVFVTLIRNAAKYARGRSPAIIEVGCRKGRANELVAYVRDNGLCHDPLTASAARAADDQLGLANVQRIVARHGGRVWSDATPGVGAVFFSLPRENGEDIDHR